MYYHFHAVNFHPFYVKFLINVFVTFFYGDPI